MNREVDGPAQTRVIVVFEPPHIVLALILKLLFVKVEISTMFDRKIFKSNNNQWRITIPPSVVKDLDLEHGEELEIESITRGVKTPQIRIKKKNNDEQN